MAAYGSTEEDGLNAAPAAPGPTSAGRRALVLVAVFASGMATQFAGSKFVEASGPGVASFKTSKAKEKCKHDYYVCLKKCLDDTEKNSNAVWVCGNSDNSVCKIALKQCLDQEAGCNPCYENAMSSVSYE
mmetsp:Transcript_29179/g.90268  ORF Transcript_29179/g.90268 Transcript_29179/m.90268 type:complete len:130 (-) Transcript_29179:46-435(-)